jgi:hypothetical protein
MALIAVRCSSKHVEVAIFRQDHFVEPLASSEMRPLGAVGGDGPDTTEFFARDFARNTDPPAQLAKNDLAVLSERFVTCLQSDLPQLLISAPRANMALARAGYDR